jgi:ketosteroid isomerase-like protein
VSENLDLVRSLIAATERGELLQPAEWADPEIEWVIADGPTAGSWVGVAAMAESIRTMLVAWDHFRAFADEYRELDDERVLVLVRRSGRGKKSGLELEHFQTLGAALLHVRVGKVTRIVNHYDRDRALADLGLAPEGGPRDS